MFEAGEIEAIRNYCETDVCTTLLIFLRWQLFNGTLSEGAYARSVLGIRNYLEEESSTRPHFAQFLAAWEEIAPS
jgi:predicted PolB exonuclease-like 3'-5' exonuclease